MSKIPPKEAQTLVDKLGKPWKLAGNSIVGNFTFPDFQQALDFTSSVGNLAEDLWHHPDIFLAWGKVEITITTHDEGGLTKKDLELASEIKKKYRT